MIEGLHMEWFQILAGVGITVLLGVVAANWLMFKERITLVRDELCRQIGDTNKHLEREVERLNCEIDRLRKSNHFVRGRLASLETYVKYFVPRRELKDVPFAGGEGYTPPDLTDRDPDSV